MERISLNEAVAQLPELIDAAMRGEEILIAGNGDQVVKLTPVPVEQKARQAGTAKGMVVFIADDFDAPLDDFKE